MQVFKATMTAKVLVVFFFFAALTAGAVAWAFRSGFLWTGICLVAVAGPLSLLYWYVLWANPARTHFALLDEGLHLKAPPFFQASVPWEEIVSVSLADWNEKGLGITDSKRSMRFGGYVSGVFELKSGQECLVCARPGKVVVIDTGARRYVLGPNRVDEFHQAVSGRVS